MSGGKGTLQGMTTMTRDDLVKLGLNAVLDGRLSDMRTKTGLSRHGMARLIGVDPQALREWERLERMMTLVTAERVGRWFDQAEEAIDNGGIPIDFTQMIPASGAAMLLNIHESLLASKLAKDHLEFERFGVLGLFVYRDQIPALAI